ncbi:hypothetical protein HYW42_00745 [Candidatus Daviesbacteria bacterium]|nr:hypothetical protein [Candidatus Daviesbacteria bacterium]
MVSEERGQNALREEILAEARRDLTTITTGSVGNSDRKEALVGDDYQRVVGYIPFLARKAMPRGYSVSPDLTLQLNFLAGIYYQAGQRLAPFYASVADWIDGIKDVDQKTGQKKEPIFIFEGRDSLGFLIAYSKRHDSKWLYSPSSRGALYAHLAPRELYPNQKSDERRDLRDFYLRNGLANKAAYFVDFGFRGTLPREQQLILAQDNQSRPAGITILLVAYFTQDGSGNPYGLLPDANTPSLKSIDRANLDRTISYFYNCIKAGLSLDFYKTVSAHEFHPDTLFLKTLQELPAYIKEARQDGFARREKRRPFETSLGVISLQELVAKYAFMQSLRGIDFEAVDGSAESAENALNGFYRDFYLAFPQTFSFMTDFSLKLENDSPERFIYDRLHNKLLEHGMNLVLS